MNLRSPYELTGLANPRIRPLCHLSERFPKIPEKPAFFKGGKSKILEKTLILPPQLLLYGIAEFLTIRASQSSHFSKFHF